MTWNSTSVSDGSHTIGATDLSRIHAGGSLVQVHRLKRCLESRKDILMCVAHQSVSEFALPGAQLAREFDLFVHQRDLARKVQMDVRRAAVGAEQ